jgi:hypothetical protein
MVVRRAWEMYPSLMEEGPASLATTASVLGPFGIPVLHLSTIRPHQRVLELPIILDQRICLSQ